MNSSNQYTESKFLNSQVGQNEKPNQTQPYFN